MFTGCMSIKDGVGESQAADAMMLTRFVNSRNDYAALLHQQKKG